MESSSDIYLELLPNQYPLAQVARFFQTALHAPSQEIGDQQISSQPVNPVKNSTIIMDVQRTRSSIIPKSMRPEMQKMLIHFCRLQKVEYKQGMNEILAPFIYLRTAGLSMSKCYGMFRTFFDQYCLNFYYDKDFNSLQVIFKMVTVMIKYHDPALARYLQNYQIQPQIYCISWLMTLFSSKLSLRLTYSLWQLMALQKDDYFIFFLIIAIIINRREAIIQTKCSSIFTIITNLIFKDDEELMTTIKIALLLRKATPASLILFFREHKIFKERVSFDRINDLLKSIDKLNLFLVGPMEVSLKQHFSLGMCQKKCYFCSLKQPLKLHYPISILNDYFPVLAKLIRLSNDVRTMDYSPQFIVIDVRGDKSTALAKIEGIRIFSVSTKQLIELVQAKFNQQFMQSRGRQHFMFLLNNFSFEKEESFQSEQFYFCNKLIKILNSYSYCYLSMLEGGEASYGYFVKELKLKSQLLNSKLMPVSEYGEEEEHGPGFIEELPIIGREEILQVSEIVSLQRLYDNHKLFIFEGEDNSEDYLLMVLEGLIVMTERNGLLERLVKHIRQKKSIINHLIDEQYVLEIPLKIIFIHSLFRIEKLTARVHHNNCILFYIFEHEKEENKKYKMGDRRELWRLSLKNMLLEELQYEGVQANRRVGFDSGSFDDVKAISRAVKGHYRTILRARKELQEQAKRLQQLNQNIIQECDFSRKDHFQEVGVTDLDM